MINSPHRVLVIGFVICALLGAAIDLIGQNLIYYSNFFSLQFPTTDQHNLSLARYYWSIGNLNKAITEYQRVIPTLSGGESDSANKELEILLLFEKSTQGKIISTIAYYSWLLPAKFYELAFLFLLLLVSLFIYRRVRKTPKFVIQNFYDYAGLNIGSNLPQIAIDRIHEIGWHAQNLESVSNLITDNIEIPTLSLMSEGDNKSTVDLLEAALTFSVGLDNLPFSSMISIMKLWLEQPLFLVRGVIDKKGEVINLKMSLHNRRKNSLEKVWFTEIPCTENFTPIKIVDAIIYPLLYYFNNVSATRWESLQALHNGLEEFQLFKDDQLELDHFQFARQQLERALALDPGYDIAKYNLSLLLLATGEFEKARDYLKELSASSEDSRLKLRASYNHGVALFLMSQDWAYDQAVKIFKELLIKNEYTVKKVIENFDKAC